MRILAIDTAATACSAALWQDGVILQRHHEAMARGQDARLLPLLQELMQTAGSTFTALDRIAVTRGPGSFTGLRIGLAAARGLGLALNIPVIGIDRFRLYRAALTATDLLIALDSRRDELFCQHLSGAEAAVPFRATAAALQDYDRSGIAVCGDGATALSWQQAQVISLPDSEACLAAALAATADPAAPHWQPLPLYLRPPDVSCGPTPPVEEAGS